MSLRVKSIKNGIEAGTSIPFHQDGGNIGEWVEDQLSNNGHQVSDGNVPDLEDLGVEVKTRKIGSSSKHTIGKMTPKAIARTPYRKSSIFKKIQQQYRVKYDDDLQVVVSSEVFDFRDEFIQEYIEKAYEAGRAQIKEIIKNGHEFPSYITGTEFGHFNKQKTSYQFRIPDAAMKKIEYIAKSRFNKLFD
jgi:hypothetical protein